MLTYFHVFGHLIISKDRTISLSGDNQENVVIVDIDK